MRTVAIAVLVLRVSGFAPKFSQPMLRGPGRVGASRFHPALGFHGAAAAGNSAWQPALPATRSADEEVSFPAPLRKGLTSRRAVVWKGLGVLGAAMFPRPTFAAGPELLLQQFPPGSLGRKLIEDKFRPEVRPLPRPRLEQDFAVLLMRSSYAAADELDFMPMDGFQKEQFLFRQEEWDTYRTKVPVTQGDLTDPAYFDFISFCQYATIASGMRNARVVFEELVDANGTAVVVARDASLPRANADLPAAHADRVGDRILDWILEKQGGLAPRLWAPGRATAADLVEGLGKVSTVFLLNEFALTASLEPLADGAGVRWTLVAPANLWGAQVLQLRGDSPRNDFEVKAALAYLRRCGVAATCTSQFEKGTQVTHEIRWPRLQVAV